MDYYPRVAGVSTLAGNKVILVIFWRRCLDTAWRLMAEPATILVANADDFGLSKEINKGIVSAFHNGILRSTSLMPNGDAFDNAVEIALANPGLGIGIHISLVGERHVAAATICVGWPARTAIFPHLTRHSSGLRIAALPNGSSPRGDRGAVRARPFHGNPIHPRRQPSTPAHVSQHLRCNSGPCETIRHRHNDAYPPNAGLSP